MGLHFQTLYLLCRESSSFSVPFWTMQCFRLCGNSFGKNLSYYNVTVPQCIKQRLQGHGLTRFDEWFDSFFCGNAFKKEWKLKQGDKIYVLKCKYLKTMSL